MASVYGRGSKLLKPKMLGIRNMTEIRSLSFLVKKFGSCFDEVTLLTFFWGGEEHLNVFNATVRKRLMPIVVEMIGNGRGCLVKLSPSLASVWRHLMTANLTTQRTKLYFESFVESRQPFCFAPKSRYMTANSSFMTSDIIHLHGVFKTTMPQGWSGLLLCHSWSFGFPFTCQMDMLSMVTMLITLQCGGFVVAFIGALFLCYCCWLPGSCGWCVPWVGRWSIKEDMGVALSRLVSWCFARKGGSGSHGLFQIFLRTFWRLICGV